ncbi:MAG: hypothetical protein EOP83_09410 [Verrucomicrobiaceae bacterium]|nr:MAG: hypothetical protein EOP83_09410 [Verrucomicrobiaceae bacterium]
MIPDSVSFTELEFDPRTVLRPRKITNGTFPSHWVRHQFQLPHDVHANMMRIDRWIENNLHGRWASYSIYGFEALTVVVLFEETTDAVMFRLQGGERAWMDEI